MSDTPQGEGWWQASDGKWYPPEQAPANEQAAQPAAGQPAMAGAGGGTVSVGEALNYGWTKFQSNVGQLIVAAIIGFVINMVLVGLGYLALAATVFAGAGSVECSTNSAGVYTCETTGGGGIFLTLIGMGLFGLLYFLGQYSFRYIMIKAGLLVTAGEEPDTSKLLEMQNVGPYLVASLLMAVFVGIGFLLCVIPGIIIAFLGYFYGYYILDKGMAPMDGIKASVDLVRNNVGTLLVFVIAAAVINGIGAAICGIGLLVTLPLTEIAAAWIYKQADGQPVAA